MDREFIEARIARTKELIVAYEDAIEALTASGPSGAQTYILETAQTRETVTRADLGKLRQALQSQENRLATYEARLRGAGIVGRPGW